MKSKSESTSTTTTSTSVQACNAVGENVMANNNNKKCSTSAGNSSSGSNSVDHSLSSMVTNVMTPDPPILVVILTQGKILSFTITYLFFLFKPKKITNNITLFWVLLYLKPFNKLQMMTWIWNVSKTRQSLVENYKMKVDSKS